jgi:hypothetical protein
MWNVAAVAFLPPRAKEGTIERADALHFSFVVFIEHNKKVHNTTRFGVRGVQGGSSRLHRPN